MWHEDKKGVELGSAVEAFEHLRAKAERAIAYADRNNVDLRSMIVKLRDGAGNVLFEGTLEEAARLQFGSDAPIKGLQERGLGSGLAGSVPSQSHLVHLTEVDSNTLQVGKQHLDTVVRASSDVLYRMSPDWSEMRMLEGNGFIPDTVVPRMTWLNTYIPPEDRLAVLDGIQQAMRSKTVFSLEHRVIRGDGSLGWTRSCAVPIIDEKGNIQEWFGAADDITARREAEAQSRASCSPHLRIATAANYRTVLKDAIGDWFRQQPCPPTENLALDGLAMLIEQRLVDAGLIDNPNKFV